MTVRRGIVMAEAILAAAVVGGVAVAAMSLVGSVAAERRVSAERSRGHLLVRQLAEEIAALPVDAPDLIVEGSGDVVGGLLGGLGDVVESVVGAEDVSDPVPQRLAFDEITDYAGLSESPPRSRDGVAVPGADGWTRAAEVTEVSASDPEGGETAGTGLFRVRVSASIQGRVAGEVTFYRALAFDGAQR